jgi:putative ABC transport system permease protein
MNWIAAREGVGIAVDALRSNKARAALTILGIVIGVATVMAMAALIGGVKSSITGELEAMGPTNFMVMRFDQTQIRLVNDGSQRPPWEGKPPITLREAEMIQELPTIRSAAASVGLNADVRTGSKSVSNVSILGRGFQWPEYAQGEFLSGHNFLPSDQDHSATTVVISSGLADVLFPGVDATGKTMRIKGELFTVAGVYRMKPNLFQNDAAVYAIVPPTTAIKRLDANKDWMDLLVVPQSWATQQEAMDEVMVSLRSSRGLRPADENNFALVRQEAFLDLFNRITGAFFMIMLVLSSIGLMVGGVGVVAIMMISVTERTREIGVRKALGATRKEILWQFLIESMTVTVIGGLIGMAVGAAGAFLLAQVTPIPAAVPLWSVGAALIVSAVTGIGFGLYPANKASRMDPVEALRYE